MKCIPIKLIILGLLLFTVPQAVLAQQHPGKRKITILKRLQKTIWTVGVSGVIIYDSGKQFKSLFNATDTWNTIWIPSKLNVEGFIAKGWSADGAFTFSQLQAGKLLDAHNHIRTYTANLIAFDASAKYDLNELIGDTKYFSPYALAGFGYTYRGLPEPRQKNALTGNFGLGCTLWFYKGFGVNVQTMAKFALNRGRNGASNYMQHSLGIVYRFNVITGYKTPGRLGHRYNLFRN